MDKFEELPENIKKFLLEIKEVSIKHRLTISHQDGNGAFIIEDFNEGNLRWLFQADDETKREDK